MYLADWLIIYFTISGGMPGVSGDIPCEGIVADSDSPTGIAIKAINLGEGGGLAGAQCIELSEEEEPGCITDVGVVSRRVLSGAVFVNEAGCEHYSSGECRRSKDLNVSFLVESLIS